MRRLFGTWTLAAVVGIMPAVAACGGNRADDAPDFGARVNDTLRDANLDDVRADWKRDERELHLSGEVQQAADRARAEELAQQVVGTSGRIVNEVKVEGIDTGERDNRIEEQLGRMFEDRTEWDFDGRGVTFDAEAGVVTITGTVESQQVKDRIGQRARQVEGVRDVVNNLEVEPRQNRRR
jgi:hyperosmotically inducible periplasmic protein